MTTTQSLSGANASAAAEAAPAWPASLFRTVREWQLRFRSRRELLMLSGRDLGDVRLTRIDAVSEATKPFWKA